MKWPEGRRGHYYFTINIFFACVKLPVESLYTYMPLGRVEALKSIE